MCSAAVADPRRPTATRPRQVSYNYTADVFSARAAPGIGARAHFCPVAR